MSGRIITQVEHTATNRQAQAVDGKSAKVTLDMRGTEFTLSRDEIMALPECILLCIFPNGVFLDSQGWINSNSKQDPSSDAETHYLSVNFDPMAMTYILNFFRSIESKIDESKVDSNESLEDKGDDMPSTLNGFPSPTASLLLNRTAVIVLREDLDYYIIPSGPKLPREDISGMKIMCGQVLCRQNSIFSGLRRGTDAGTAEQHLIDMLCASGFDEDDTWGHRSLEPTKTVISSMALANLTIESTQPGSGVVGMAQKLLLFWRKPARKCWWDGLELEKSKGVDRKMKVWIRRVWTLETWIT